MGAVIQGLGSLAQSEGEAFQQQRQFDMQKALADARARLESAQANQANAQAGHFTAMAELQKELAQRDRWQPMSTTPFRLSPQQIANLPPEDRAQFSADNPWAIPMRDTFHGTIKYIPAGSPANSVESVMGQLGAMGMTPDKIAAMPPEQQARLLMGILFKNTTGSASTMFGGLQSGETQQGNTMQGGVQDKLTNTFTPTPGMQKGVPLQWQAVPEMGPDGKPTGRTVLQPVPTRASVGGGGGAAMPTAGAGAGKGNGGGIIKDIPKYSPEAAGMLMNLRSASPLVGDLLKAIGDAKKEQAGSIFDKAATQFEWSKYKLGLPTSSPFYQKAFAMADLYRNIMTGFYTHGIRRGDLIEKIQAHMPTATDTPAMMYQKAVQLQSLNPQIEKAIMDWERERVQGVPIDTPTVDPNNPYRKGK